MSKISIYTDDKYIILKYDYENENYRENYLEKLKNKDTINLRNTFKLNIDKLVNKEVLESKDEYCEIIFKIGERTDNFYILYKDVFEIENSFYFEKGIELKNNYFFVYDKISLIKNIDEVIDSDIYSKRKQRYSRRLY